MGLSDTPPLLTVIGARSTSRRLSHKHWQELGDCHVIDWTLQHIAWLATLGVVIVSSDDSRILQRAESVAQACGGYPAGRLYLRLRPEAVSSDHATSAQMVIDAVGAFCHEHAQSIESFGGILLLQPTSPLRRRADIAQSLHLANFGTAAMRAVISVTPAKPVSWIHAARPLGAVSGLWRLEKLCDKESVLETMTVPKVSESGASSMPDASCACPVIPNGAIYLAPMPEQLCAYTPHPPAASGMMMPLLFSIDLDTQEDLSLARAVVAAMEPELDIPPKTLRRLAEF